MYYYNPTEANNRSEIIMHIDIKIDLDDVIHDMFQDESSDLTEQVKRELRPNVVRSVTE